MDDTSFGGMVATGDIETVKAKIQEKYGFTPTDEYVKDLIQFVNDMLAGDEGMVEDDEESDDDNADFDGEDDNDYPEG